VGKYDRTDHGHEQDKPGDFEGEQVLGIEQLTEGHDIGDLRRGHFAPAKCRTRLPGAVRDNHLAKKHKRDNNPERKVASEPRSQ
jgi:hypothetical protein